MTAKEQLLERVPGLTEAQAVAALRVLDAQIRAVVTRGGAFWLDLEAPDASAPHPRN